METINKDNAMIINAQYTKKERERALKKNIQFLVELHKNVQMAKLALEKVLPKCRDGRLKSELLRQYHDFEKLSTNISGALIEQNSTPKSATARQSIMLKMGISLSLTFNNSAKKIANMVIQGDNQGIIDINRLVNQSSDATDKSKTLAKMVLETEQRHLDSLKSFL